MMTTYRRAYTVLTALLILFLIYTVSTKNWLQTDLTALLPSEQQPDALLTAADKAGEEQLNTQVILLAGSKDAETAFQTTSEIAALWRKSGVFQQVDSSVTPDLDKVRADIGKLGLALLPNEQVRLLFEHPQAYFQARAEAAVNPFAAPSPLSLEQDWLGFGRFVAGKANPQSRLQWNMDNGMLFTEGDDGKTWVWLRGKLAAGDNFSGNNALLPLIAESRKLAKAKGADTLTAGGALFAAASKTEAEQESRTMSTVGMLLTFALLLWVFRSVRVFWLTLPVAAGMLTGLAAALLVFGEVHILTIVIGTSLVGMLVDFPLHWLAPSVFGTRAKNGKTAFSDQPRHETRLAELYRQPADYGIGLRALVVHAAARIAADRRVFRICAGGRIRRDGVVAAAAVSALSRQNRTVCRADRTALRAVGSSENPSAQTRLAGIGRHILGSRFVARRLARRHPPMGQHAA